MVTRGRNGTEDQGGEANGAWLCSPGPGGTGRGQKSNSDLGLLQKGTCDTICLEQTVPGWLYLAVLYCRALLRVLRLEPGSQASVPE